MNAEPPNIAAESSPVVWNVERRAQVRYHCRLEGICGPPEMDAEFTLPALVHDISTAGARLRTRLSVEPGAVLSLVLPGCVFPICRAVRVVHVGQERDGQRFLGCQFLEPLTDDELHCLAPLS